MEVDKASFAHYLLELIVHISEAEFVSFDLELSGIPSHLPDKPFKPRQGARATLEDRYAEAKCGADRYQILQVGLTCAIFDHAENRYVLRPYNINLSPLLDERLDIEREFSFQSGACSFLLSHGFDLGAPFAHGVQYLSREEAATAKEMAWNRLDNKNTFEDLQLKPEDVHSLDFLRRVRESINAWITDNSSSLHVTTHIGLEHQPTISAISRFEKRLVHQLVRAEYPNLVTISRSDCVQIVHFDAAREAGNKARIKQRVKEQILRQTGFRWIFEALAADGDIRQSHPSYLSHYNDRHDRQDLCLRHDRAVERLRQKRPVLVGHNMFTDVVYFYRTFVGKLPDTLPEFQSAVNKLFPMIVDTKYLATHAEGDLNASPSLQEIADGLNRQPLPDIITHASHTKYHSTEAFHEAGFDSLLTATIMLRLAAKLGPQEVQQMSTSQDDFQAEAKVSPPSSTVVAVMSQTKNSKKKKRRRDKAAKSRFETRNLFDQLRELDIDAEDQGSPEPSEQRERDSLGAGASISNGQPLPWYEETVVQDKRGWVPIEQRQRKAMELIPSFDSEFWQDFGNKLRVFGSQETVLHLADWPA